MHVHGLLILDELPDWDKLMSAVFDRIVTKYRVLSQIPVQRDGDWFWDDVDFAMSRHLTRVVLDGSPTDAAPVRVEQVLDRFRPEPAVVGDAAHLGSDRQMAPARCSPGSTTGLVTGSGWSSCSWGRATRRPALHRARSACRVRRAGASSAPSLHVADHSVRDTIDYVQRAGSAAVEAGRNLRASINPSTCSTASETASTWSPHPVRFIDAITSISSGQRLGELVAGDQPAGPLQAGRRRRLGGHPSGDKGVAWVAGLSLPAVKKAAKTYRPRSTTTSSPPSPSPDPVPARARSRRCTTWRGSCRSRCGPSTAKFALKPGQPLRRRPALDASGHRRRGELVAGSICGPAGSKHSAEPAVAFGMQQVIAEVPGSVARALTDFFSDKTIGPAHQCPRPRVPAHPRRGTGADRPRLGPDLR